MPTKPIGYGAGNELTTADDGSALSDVPASGLAGTVPQANGGLAVDASLLADGLLAKDAGAFLTTTSISIPGVSTEAKQDDTITVLTDGSQLTQIQALHQNGVTTSVQTLDEFDAANVNIFQPQTSFGLGLSVDWHEE